MDRCPEMVVALLALFKAGGVYVPLDATLPVARLRFMIADAGLEIVLAHECHLEALAGCDTQVWCLDEELAAIALKVKTTYQRSRAEPCWPI